MVGKINSLFKNEQNYNAKDFILFILERLHKELKKNININNNNNNSNVMNNINVYDKKSVINNVYSEFTKQ